MNTRSPKNYVLIGGPLDGKQVALPDDRETYAVPVHNLPFLRIPKSLDEPIEAPDLNVEYYRKMAFKETTGENIEIMVHQSIAEGSVFTYILQAYMSFREDRELIRSQYHV